ncbi:hypothetical protein [Saccharolobus caldissimus]|uniref:Uncharacterized protein n=1 Tax=Saccharolobus caldissimus TaxID=1702097 RepID=A0AAQ4CSL0_9CREN|nr:hypothetical protein [Saccharolobus caldissimus]BDB98791.1 hypothetical protein SACC_18080 [Saccharolobus caldissimus]
MIDVTNNYDTLEDLIGDINGVKIFMNYNFWHRAKRIHDMLTDQLIKSLILLFPSEVIIRHIFGDKVKIGNLILDLPPNIVIVPYYVIKTLKEWDLLLHNEKIAEDGVVVVNVNNICDSAEYVYPAYDYIARVFEQHYLANCGIDKLEKLKYSSIRTKLREGIDAASKGKPSVMYKSEAEYLKLSYVELKAKVDFYIGLFKNSSKQTINAYEILRKSKIF